MEEYVSLDKQIEITDIRGGTIKTTVRHILEINYARYDVQPVVRCRDCKHKGWVQEPEHGKSVDYCRLIERCVDKQFFCAAGERETVFTLDDCNATAEDIVNAWNRRAET